MKLRPHHLLCIQNFTGKGYSDAFTAHMTEIIDQLEKDPEVELVEGCDELCSACPHNVDEICNSEEKVNRYDKCVLEACGLAYGECRSWSVLAGMAKEYVFLTDRFEEICSDCQWYGICSMRRLSIIHPWKDITLSDYENHMSLSSVQQLQTLNQAMKQQLNWKNTPSVMILGIAGGNGLEHLDVSRYETVYGVDINDDYLTEVKRRFPELDGIMKCICLDISADAQKLPHAELLIADLLVEYIGYNAFASAVRSVDPDFVSCVIQINEDKGFVSDSPYLHAFDRLGEIHCQIEEEVLTAALESISYRQVDREDYPLPNGKQLLRIDYEKEPQK